jgi:hypothetical protein
MFFFKVGKFDNTDVLQSTLESFGFWGILRDAQALDCFGRPVGKHPFPLVVQKTYPLHADMFYVQDTLYADQQDQMYIQSLGFEQRYAELKVQTIIKQHKLFVENIVPDESDVVYQTFCEVPANIRISKRGEITLTLFPNFPNIMPTLKNEFERVELKIL